MRGTHSCVNGRHQLQSHQGAGSTAPGVGSVQIRAVFFLLGRTVRFPPEVLMASSSSMARPGTCGKHGGVSRWHAGYHLLRLDYELA